MKVVIFGANGKTGKLLVEQALAQGHQVIAYIRRPESLLIDNPGLKIIVGNLNEPLKMKDAISGSDACISALGGASLSKHSVETINGIKSIISIMEITNVYRFIYLSSLGTRESRYFIPQPLRFILTNILLRVPLADHNINESNIIKSTLQWTLIRPGSLTDGQLTGDFKHGSEHAILKGNSSISRANVAMFMLQQLTDIRYIHKGVWLHE